MRVGVILQPWIVFGDVWTLSVFIVQGYECRIKAAPFRGVGWWKRWSWLISPGDLGIGYVAEEATRSLFVDVGFIGRRRMGRNCGGRGGI